MERTRTAIVRGIGAMLLVSLQAAPALAPTEIHAVRLKGELFARDPGTPPTDYSETGVGRVRLRLRFQTDDGGTSLRSGVLTCQPFDNQECPGLRGAISEYRVEESLYPAWNVTFDVAFETGPVCEFAGSMPFGTGLFDPIALTGRFTCTGPGGRPPFHGVLKCGCQVQHSIPCVPGLSCRLSSRSLGNPPTP
jgi:hypothetical protein